MDLINGMRAFVRVYETGSFSLAATQLDVRQPAISKTIAQLEDRFETKLFLRSTRGLAPTDAGQRFYEHAVRTLDEADLATEAVKAAGATLTGRLRVSGTVTFMRQHIIPKLAAFLDPNPALQIDLLLHDGNIDLIEESVDVALRMGNLASSSLVARRIGRCRRVVVATPDYFSEKGLPKRPEDLLDHHAIIFSRGEGGESVTFVRAGRSREVVLVPRLRISALEGIRAAALAGLGLAVATEWIFAEELGDGQMSEALADWHMPPLDLWAVLPGGQRASAKARAFIAFVEDQLKGTPFGIK